MVRDRQTTAMVRIVRIHDLSKLLSGEMLHMNLFPGTQFTVIHDTTEQKSDDVFIWIGRFTDVQGSVILVSTAKGLTGTIRADLELYRMEPLGAGLQAIIRVDQSKFPPDHPPEIDGGEPQFDDGSTFDNGGWVPPPLGKVLTHTNTVIDVLVAYTASAASASGDINGLIQLAICGD